MLGDLVPFMTFTMIDEIITYKGTPVDAPMDIASTGSSSMTTSGANAGLNTVGKYIAT